MASNNILVGDILNQRSRQSSNSPSNGKVHGWGSEFLTTFAKAICFLALVGGVGYALFAFAYEPGYRNEPETSQAPTVTTASVQDRPSFKSGIAFASVNGNEATEGELPSAAGSVKAHLLSCKKIDGRFRWFFRVVNTGSNPWTGTIRLYLVLSDGRILWTEDFKTDRALTKGEGRVVPFFATETGPTQLGGNVNQYGWKILP